jgi:ubiquinol-cytochrome c reductase cytochrome c1 subunit
MMRNLWSLIAAVMVLSGPAATAALAAEGEALPPSGTDIRDVESLRRGAHNFMNYCSGCHSLKYLRYNRIGRDLQIPEAELKAGLMFTSEKPFDTVISALPGADAEAWFGKQPPDLSLIARSKSPDYIFAYLKDYYVDKTRPWGVNNLLLPGTAMPAVLAGLQGLQKPVMKNVPDEHGNATLVLDGVAPMTPGAMKPEEYDRFVRDTANFLDYAAEPVKAKRQSLGVYVIAFLLVFFVLAVLLKKEYWKDVH